MKTRTTTAAALALLALPALAACDSTSAATPAPSTHASTAAPSVTSTPAATTSSSPTASTSPSTAELQAQATAAYRAIFDAFNTSAITGGIAPGQKPPAAISDNATGQALADEITELNQLHSVGIRRVSGDFELTKIRLSEKMRAGSIIALDSCEDGSSIVNHRSDGSTSHGRLIYKTSYYAMDHGKLKMTYYWGDEVKTCPIP